MASASEVPEPRIDVACLAACFRELTEETAQIPRPLRDYINYEAMARDAQLNGEVFAIETAHDEVHVFWTR
ncbi:Antirestriction protein (ArdA) [Caulobacter sp. AP07]|uniref:antirestriction protein ArdA n=1 Tax=Caulobacter sp. AP07 TaxID=1144304 RepID=UPI0002720754|nr:antirestriction protein ArdA [Caulobacter sp. AP07]EJL25215.1 Antirestriction protein (ArdA) [Caulobacter sp. AP07]